MQVLVFQLGDPCWIATGEEELAGGRVIHIFEHYGLRQYVVEVETHIEPALLVRDGLIMSDAADRPLGFWRR